MFAALIVACIATWSISWHQGLDALRTRTAGRVERVNDNLKSTLDRYALLPYLLANHPYIQDTLTGAGMPAADPAAARPLAAPSIGAQTAASALILRANRFLTRLNHEANASASYVIDASGVCIAASNWDQPVSFIGQHYLFRPYFTEAIQGGIGRFFAIGTSNAEPGYFVSQPVRGRNGNIIGVAAVKLDLEWFQRTDSSEPLIVTDEHGVIFLSSEPQWKYHTVQPLQPEIESAVYRSRQYAQQRLVPLPIVVEQVLGDGARIVRIGAGHHAARYLATTSQLREPHWQLTSFTSLAPVIASANYAMAITGFSGICLFLLGFYLRVRRARILDMIRSGALLRAAYAELNQRVDERTADLSAANARLQTEVSERTRAEQELRAAHRELVQASKLAALGQMAAGITHELNQPLAALRAFSDNTRIFLERGQTAAAQDNLEAIASLTDRMGRITNQLKLFIGKARPRDVSTPVPRAIANALTVLASRLAAIQVGVWYDPVCRLDDTERDTRHDSAGRSRSDSGRHHRDDNGGDLQVGPVDIVRHTHGAEDTVIATPQLDALTIANVDAHCLPIDLNQVPDTPAVWCDQLRLEQLLINVIGNAADALLDPTQSETGQSAARIDLILSTTPSSVSVAVADNGPGIRDEVIAHLFEPFFTTKESGEGLGLGLAISAAIASEYGGTLTAHRAAGNGAVFLLTLRRSDGAARQALLAAS